MAAKLRLASPTEFTPYMEEPEKRNRHSNRVNWTDRIRDIHPSVVKSDQWWCVGLWQNPASAHYYKRLLSLMFPQYLFESVGYSKEKISKLYIKVNSQLMPPPKHARDPKKRRVVKVQLSLASAISGFLSEQPRRVLIYDANKEWRYEGTADDAVVRDVNIDPAVGKAYYYAWKVNGILDVDCTSTPLPQECNF
jgi:hypothetical protein